MMKTKAIKMAAGEIFKSDSLCVLCVLWRPFNFGFRAKAKTPAATRLPPALFETVAGGLAPRLL
jgi:hypothetical protein